jgi:hypothetical protein
MNRIQPFLLFFVFIFSCSYPNWSAEDARDNRPQDRLTSSTQPILTVSQSKRVSFAIDTPIVNLERQVRTQRTIADPIPSQQDELLRLHARSQIDIFNISGYRITDIRVNCVDGFFEKVDFFDVNNRKLRSSRLPQQTIPLWSVQPMALQDAQGRMFFHPFLCFYGHAYKQEDGRYWRWVYTGVTRVEK